MVDDLKEIYSVPTIEQAEANLEEYADKWDSTHPKISKSWRSNWQRIIPYFAYGENVSDVYCQKL